MISLASVADPEQPVTIKNLVAQFAPRTEVRMRGVRWLKFAIAVVALAALATLWQLMPVADVITSGRVTHWASEFAGTVWAPLIVLAAYTPAALVMFPRPLITLFAVVALGPWLGFGYAMSGILIAALVAAVAMALGIATLLVRRWLLTTQLHGESTRA